MRTINPLRLATIALTCLALGATATVQARSPSTNDPVRVPIMQSSDFDFVATVFGEVLKEAGYRVEYVNADYSATFPGVKAGDLDVTFGWDTGPDQINDVIDSGKGIMTGSTGVAIAEGLVVPRLHRRGVPGPA